MLYRSKNFVLMVGDNKKTIGLDANLESESMIRRALGMGSQNVVNLKELLNTFTNNILLSENSFKNLNEIVQNNAQDLSTEKLSGAIFEIQDALNKSPMIEKKTAQLAKNIVSQMELLKDRQEIKELEVAKNKMNTWNKLFDKKTYNEAKETLNSKENLNKLGEYAEKVSNDKNISPEVKDKLMGKISNLLNDMGKNIDNKINKDQKEIDKQVQKTKKYGKEIENLQSKLAIRQEKSQSRESDIKQLESNTSINNPKIQNAINKLSKENLNKLDSSHDKEKKLANQVEKVSFKNELSGINKEALKEKVENRQEMKGAVERVGKHVEKYKADKADKAANKGNDMEYTKF